MTRWLATVVQFMAKVAIGAIGGYLAIDAMVNGIETCNVDCIWIGSIVVGMGVVFWGVTDYILKKTKD